MVVGIVVTFELFELYFWLELYELYLYENKVHKVQKANFERIHPVLSLSDYE